MISSHNNKCNIVNIVWIERGILISIINYINKLYNKIFNKIIIIDNYTYRIILKKLFPKLKFKKFKLHNINNYYFNVRKIIMNQDIIIDYLCNYNKYIPTKYFKYVPWYDLNDPLIIYKYSKKYISHINSFNIPLCVRSNYHGYTWDQYKEYKIISEYVLYFSKYTIEYIMSLINKYLNKNYTNTVFVKQNYYPYIINNQDIDSNNDLILYLTNEIKNINYYIIENL